MPFWDMDTAMASLLILQTATDAGLGACFIGIPPDKEPRCARRSASPTTSTRSASITIGHRADGEGAAGSPRDPARRKLGEVVHRGRWGG